MNQHQIILPSYTGQKHVILGDFDAWEDRFDKMSRGELNISIHIESGVLIPIESLGLEKLDEPTNFMFAKIGEKQVDWEIVAQNEGMTFYQFCKTFIPTAKPMAIIHFTNNFRYGNT